MESVVRPGGLHGDTYTHSALLWRDCVLTPPGSLAPGSLPLQDLVTSPGAALCLPPLLSSRRSPLHFSRSQAPPLGPASVASPRSGGLKDKRKPEVRVNAKFLVKIPARLSTAFTGVQNRSVLLELLIPQEPGGWTYGSHSPDEETEP